MKPGCISAAAVLTLLGTVVCKPIENHDGHGHGKRESHKKAQMTVIDSSVNAPTEVPQAIVYVNKHGVPIRTATEAVMFLPPPRTMQPILQSTLPSTSQSTLPSTSQSTLPSTLPSTSQSTLPSTPQSTLQFTSRSPESTALPDTTTRARATSVTTSDAFTKTSDPETAAPSQSSTSSGSHDLYGIAYAPYNAAGNCKSAEQVEADFSTFEGTYSVVRIYGTDCGQVAHAYSAAKKAGLKLFLGLFELDPVEKQVSEIVSAVKDDWSVVDTVSVGNELVNNGQATSQDVTTAVGKARQLLRAAGYLGPVVTVDTFVAVQDHPELCDLSDYCAINVHPFFDGNTTAGDAGDFVQAAVARVKSKLANRNKRVVVTETGWPWQGSSNGEAVPGLSQQKLALDSIRAAFSDKPDDVILFSAFNDLWKPAEAGTFFAERYWGIGGVFSAADK